MDVGWLVVSVSDNKSGVTDVCTEDGRLHEGDFLLGVAPREAGLAPWEVGSAERVVAGFGIVFPSAPERSNGGLLAVKYLPHIMR